MDKSITDIDKKLLVITLRKVIYLSFLAYSFYFLVYTILSVQKYAPAIITIGVGILIHLGLIVLLNRKLNKLANVLFLILSELLLVILTYFIVGPTSGTQYYFLIFAIFALPVYRKKSIAIFYCHVNC